MSVLRQGNWLGQARVDVPHLRALESSIAADFDALAGGVMAGGQALVVRGLEIEMSGALSNPATALQLIVADSVMLHPLASESGTLFAIDPNALVETLSTSNTKVVGGFTANATNYIGIDLYREADDTTSDVVMFFDPDTKLETPKTVPLARTLKYRIVISTADFTTKTHLCPVAKVQTDASNLVTEIHDCRQMLFRLGKGGTTPDHTSTFAFGGDRVETTTASTVGSPDPDIFTNGDKSIHSDKDWRDALMTRIWEVGGGEHWFSASSDRDSKLAFGTPVLSNNDNFVWTSGTSTLQWSGLSVIFGNSPAWYNTITAGSAVLADGQALYVDVNRSTNATALTAAVGTLASLGTPAVPGSRYIIAWRKGSDIFVRDRAYEVGRLFPVASTTVSGTVKLSVAAGTPLDPVVVPLDGNGTATHVAATSTQPAFKGTALGAGPGVLGVASATALSSGVKGTGASGTYGVFATQSGVLGADTAFKAEGGGIAIHGTTTVPDGTGVRGEGGPSGGDGVQGIGGLNNGYGVYGEGSSDGSSGVRAVGTGNSAGLSAVGAGTGAGVSASGGGSASATAYGVYGAGGGTSATPSAGVAGLGRASSTAATTAGGGVIGTGGTATSSAVGGVGVAGTGGSANSGNGGIGVLGTGGSTISGTTGVGVYGTGSSGVHGQALGNGKGVRGTSSATAGSFGGYFESSGSGIALKVAQNAVIDGSLDVTDVFVSNDVAISADCDVAGTCSTSGTGKFQTGANVRLTDNSKSFEYSVARTGYVWISPAQCNLSVAGSAVTFAIITPPTPPTHIGSTTGTGTQISGRVIGVPAGATITDVKIMARDSAANPNVTVDAWILRKTSTGFDSTDNIVSNESVAIATSASPNWYSVPLDGATDKTMPTDGDGLLLIRVFLPATASADDIRFYMARIAYSETVVRHGM